MRELIEEAENAAVLVDLGSAAARATAERTRLKNSRLRRVVSEAFSSAVTRAATVFSFLLVCEGTKWGSGFTLDASRRRSRCQGSVQQTADGCVGDYRF